MAASKSKRILVVDDEPSVCSLIGRALESHEMDCALVTEAREAQSMLGAETFEAILCDVNMADVSGLELFQLARKAQPATPFILMTGHGTVEDAKYAIRQGAYDYLEKPLEVDHLCQIVRRAMDGRAGGPHTPADPGDTDHRDPLTGLITPRGLHERLSEIRLSSLARRENCSVLIVDVDDFAEANAIFGYAFGDALLRQLGERLARVFDDGDIICRFSGDEFIVVLPGLDEHQAAARARQARQAVSELSIRWQRRAISVAVSVGVAEAGPGFSMPVEQVLADARRALREAKRAGRDRVQVYSSIADAAGGAAALVTADLQEMAQEAAKINHRLWLACLESVRALVSAVEAKDPYTRLHSDQVAYYAEHLAKFIDLPGDTIERIRIAAMVHDVGKIGIPDSVLTKPGSLTDSEFQLVKEHPRMGADILSKISMLATERQLVLYHHERWDGDGYPAGLAGSDIPIGARVIQLADSIDAMLMRRTYKQPYPVRRVLSELADGKATQFAPDLADAAIQWVAEHPERLIQPAGALLQGVRS